MTSRDFNQIRYGLQPDGKQILARFWIRFARPPAPLTTFNWPRGMEMLRSNNSHSPSSCAMPEMFLQRPHSHVTNKDFDPSLSKVQTSSNDLLLCETKCLNSKLDFLQLSLPYPQALGASRDNLLRAIEAGREPRKQLVWEAAVSRCPVHTSSLTPGDWSAALLSAKSGGCQPLKVAYFPRFRVCSEFAELVATWHTYLRRHASFQELGVSLPKCEFLQSEEGKGHVEGDV